MVFAAAGIGFFIINKQNMQTEQSTPSWFVVISYEILTSKELTDKEKLLLGLISSLQGQQGYCYANNAYMAERLNCSPDTIKDLISNLVKIGWLNRKVYRNEKNEFIKRILTVKFTKKEGIIEEENAITPPSKIPPTPPCENPPTSVEKPPLLIDNNNIKYNKKGETEKNQNLPTLKEIIEISNDVYQDIMWREQICMSSGISDVKDLVKWMRAFNLHISNTEDITNVTDRKYKNLFIGWLRAKKANGVKLSDFIAESSNQPKQMLAPPLTRLM